jgi:hypothetical protein
VTADHHRPADADDADADDRVGVVVCRGCCCGSAEKRPDVDHDGRFAELRSFARAHPSRATVRTSECLGPCEHADLVVICPSPAARRAGARPIWLGLVDEYAVAAIVAWLRRGGPGVADLPAGLDLHRVARPRSTPVERTATGPSVS